MEKNINEATLLIGEKKFHEAMEILEHLDEDVEVLKLLGLCYLNLDKYKEARKVFETVVKYSQEDATSWYYLAICYDNLDEYANAKFAYKKVIELREQYIDAYKNLGVIYLKTREAEEAFKMAKKAIKTFPNEYLFYYLAGSSLLTMREFKKSLLYFKKAVALNDSNVQLFCNYGTAYLSCQKFDKAIETYKKALEIDDKSAIVYHNLASVYQIQNKNKEAVENYRKAYELENSEMFLSSLALAEFKTGDVEKAVDYYKQLISQHPEKQNYQYNLACCYEKMNNLPMAAGILEQLVKLHPKSKIMLLKLAGIYIAANQFEKSKEIYENLIAYGFVSDDIYYNYAMSCFKSGDLDIAERIFKKVIDLNPKFAKARKDLAVIYLTKRLFDYAEDEFKKAYETAPDDSDIVFEYANFLQAMHKCDEAKEFYDRAIELNPKNPRYYVFASLNAQVVNDLKSAVKYIEKSLKMLPEEYTILFDAGKIYYAAKKYAKAQFVLVRAWELNQNVEVENLLGLTYFAQKEYEKAFEMFEKLSAEYPMNTNILLSYAKACEKTERYEEAKIAANKILEIFDDMPEAKRMLKRIKKAEKQTK